MDNAAIQTTMKPAPASAGASAPRPREKTLGRRLKMIVSPVASLRLTVFLFVLAIILVFCGTIAYIDQGLYTVLYTYFRSLLVWIPFQVFVRFGQVFYGVSPDAALRGSFPFPGGWLIGGLLLLNLVAAHAVRFRLGWRRTGILLIHSGLVILMLSEFVTGRYAVEAHMTIGKGEAVDFKDIINQVELAIVDSSDPKSDDVVTIPGSMLRRGGLIQNDALPADIEVLEYQNNSELLSQPDGEDPESLTALNGQHYVLQTRGEQKGVETEAHEDAALVRVALRKKGTDQVLGKYLLSLWLYPNFGNRALPPFPPQRLTVDGKSYTLMLRYKRAYEPYSIRLKEFHHGIYMGTNIPKDFTSDVQLVDPSRNENRDVKISMNEPLRYHGETLYQAGVLPGDSGTVLQVVRNPGWLMPYLACGMIIVGLIVHFGMHLISFLGRIGR